MSKYIQISDFKGKTKVAKDKFTKVDLQECLDELEVTLLQDLLGCELFEEFATDFAITGTGPTDPKFVEIWEPFCIDNSFPCRQRRSEGILKMLSLLIFFHYTRDQPVKNTIGGNTVNEQSNSRQAIPQESIMFTNYNQGIDSYWAIQWIICDNPNGFDWDKFEGIRKDYISLI